MHALSCMVFVDGELRANQDCKTVKIVLYGFKSQDHADCDMGQAIRKVDSRKLLRPYVALWKGAKDCALH